MKAKKRLVCNLLEVNNVGPILGLDFGCDKLGIRASS